MLLIVSNVLSKSMSRKHEILSNTSEDIFKYLKGTKLHRYLENTNVLELYPSFKESVIRDTELSSRNVLRFRSACCNIMKLKFSMKDEFLSIIYDLIYYHNLSFMICEIINTAIENEDPMDTEYIIIFLTAVKYNDYTSIDMILLNGFDMNVVGQNRQTVLHDNIITMAT